MWLVSLEESTNYRFLKDCPKNNNELGNRLKKAAALTSSTSTKLLYFLYFCSQDTPGAEGLRDTDLQAGSGERFHDPPHIQAELPDIATRSASREHERVRLCSVGLEVAELRLGAIALLMSGLRGRQAGGERPSFGRDPTSAPCPPRPPRLTRPDCPMLPASPRGSLCIRFRRTPLTSVQETQRGRTLRGQLPVPRGS